MDRTMKKLIWLFILFGFIFISKLKGQLYVVGDTVETFDASICENGDGTWDYQTDGVGNIVWMNLFTSW